MPIVPSQTYSKHPISIEEQVVRLRDLGITIDDYDAAEQFLSHFSYYRLKGYLLAFRKTELPEKPVYPDTSFKDIVSLIKFDSMLRNLTLQAIDTIEVSIRTVFNEQLAYKYQDAFWYQRTDLFEGRKKYGIFLSKAACAFTGSKELFAQHYSKTYGKPPLPPGWMLIEVCSLGTWSHLYSNLKNSDDKKLIASQFKVSKKVFQSWLHALSDLRNACAHQSRIWNRKFGIKPMIPNQYQSQLIQSRNHPFLASADRYSVMALTIMHMLKEIGAAHYWSSEFNSLMDTIPLIRHWNMGFQPEWRNDPFWLSNES